MKGRLFKLVSAIKREDLPDAGDDIQFVCDAVQKMNAYVNKVNIMEIRMKIAEVKGIEGEEWRDLVRNMDEGRHIAHEAAIGSVNQINRLCKAYGVPAVFVGKDSTEEYPQFGDAERYEVADFCGIITSDFFNDRGHSMQLLMNGRDESEEELDNSDAEYDMEL